jgi:hypothetical protein
MSSRGIPLPSRRLCRARSMRRRKRGSCSRRYSNQSSSEAKPTSRPAGLPCRVITISSVSAKRKNLDRSSLTSDRATFLIAFTVSLKPKEDIGFGGIWPHYRPICRQVKVPSRILMIGGREKKAASSHRTPKRLEPPARRFYAGQKRDQTNWSGPAQIEHATHDPEYLTRLKVAVTRSVSEGSKLVPRLHFGLYRRVSRAESMVGQIEKIMSSRVARNISRIGESSGRMSFTMVRSDLAFL